MTTAATSLLGLALPVTGELSGTWGDTVNNSITSLLDSAVAGTTTLSTDADVTLTTTTLAANQAREAILLWTAAGTVTRTITAPAQSKTYVVINKSSTQSIKLVGAGPTAGITVLPGESTYAAWNGSDFVKVGEYGGNLTVNSLTTTASTTGSTNNGPLNYGTLSFSDTGIVQSAQTSVNSYFQNVIQNTSAGTAASAEFIAYNDQGTASTNFATVGINSSGYTGTGSINAPGYAYFLSASTDLVLGTIGANGIHFTTNSAAADALAISSAGAVSLPGGTANGVAYLNGSKVVTTGSALTFDGTNFVVGGTAVFAKSTIVNALSGTAAALGISDNATTTMYANNVSSGVSGIWSSGALAFGTNNGTFTEQMRLTSTGLGIGTTSPTTKLDVNGSGRFYSASGNTTLTIGRLGDAPYNNGLYINSAYNTTGPSFEVLAYYEGLRIGSMGAFVFGLYTGASFSEQMRLDSSGNLGIGTSSPANPLNIVKDNTAFRGQISLQTVTASNFAQLTFYDRTTLSAQIYHGYSATAGVGDFVIQTATASSIAFGTTNTERMRLDSNGNLGIGTSSPVNKFVVSNSGAMGLEVVPTGGTGSTPAIYSYNRSGAAWATLSYFANQHLWNYAGTSLGMTLDSSGNLGLGVTPSAWDSAYKALDISGNVGVAGYSNSLYSLANAYVNGGVYKYKASTYATLALQTNGQHQWYIAPSGTAGNAISFTQAMTLDASGNLLVGTTSAYNSARVSVLAAGGSGGIVFSVQNNNDTYYPANFRNTSGTSVGSISCTAATTSYNVTSDQRLKENIVDADSASSLVDALQVRQYDWKADGSHQRYGFVAQELVTVAPEAVHQPADPEEMMAVDYSKLVPMLVKEIQDLRKRLAALEAK